MNAPDKIYVKEFDGEISQMWSGIKATKTTANAQHEYIRKDALLEKIDDAIAHLSDGGLTGYYESHAYNDIRELIESM